MKFVCLLALFAVCQTFASSPLEIVDNVLRVVERHVAALDQMSQFQTLDDGPESFCDGSFLTGGGMLDPATLAIVQPLLDCIGGVCNLISPTGPCPTLVYALSSNENGCASGTVANITQNCNNGCFAKIPGAFSSVFQCFINAIPGIIQNAVNQACAMAPDPASHQACVDAVTAGFAGLSTIGDQLPLLVGQITGPLERLCLANPATGTVCYAAFVAGRAALPNPTVTDPANCAYFASLGCCLTGLKVMIGDFNGTSVGSCGGNQLVTNDQLNTILATCSATGAVVSPTNPALGSIPSCPLKGVSVKISKSSFALTGLIIAGINGLSAPAKFLLYRALQGDLATAIGLSATQTLYLNIGSITAGTGTDVIVSFVIRGDTDTATDAFAAQVTAFIAGTSTPAFTLTIAFGTANSGVVQGGAVGMNRASSTSTTETQTGASGVANLSASMLVLFFAMVVALAMRF